MSLYHSLEARMEWMEGMDGWKFDGPGNICTMMCMGGIGHALSICLDNCGIGVWLGTSRVAALISCASPCLSALRALHQPGLHAQF